MRAQQQKMRSPLQLDQVEVTDAKEAGKPPVWTLEVKVTAKSTVDLFDPMTLDEAHAWYKHDPKTYEDALRRMSRLREPERSESREKRPKADRLGALYRKSLTAGEPFSFTTRVTAEEKPSGWEFFSDPESVQLQGVTRQTTVRNEMPKEVIIIDGQQENELTKLFTERTQFVEVIRQAEVAQAARLDREHRELLAASTVWRAWLTSIPVRSGPPARVRVQFLPKTADDRIAVLVSDADHIDQRSVWTGDLELPPEPKGDDERFETRPVPDGWTIHLTPAVQDESLPLSNRPSAIRFAPGGPGQLRWISKPGPFILAEDATAPALPPHEVLVQKIAEGTVPGQVWEGTLQYQGKAAEGVRMIVTERRNDGQYLRAVVELADDPFVNAVFEGTVSTSVEAAYGFPVRLVRKTSAGPGTNFVGSRPLFYTSFVGPVGINLADTLDGRNGLRGSNLQLARGKPLSSSKTHRELWAQALEPGAQWSGTMTFGNEPASRITVTVAEVRDNGNYVRLIAVDPTMRNRFRVFEGSLNTSDPAVDGYALTVSGMFPTPLATRHDSGSNGDLFGLGQRQTQKFRLLPDGRTMVGISRMVNLEKYTLTRDEQPAPLSLLREDISKVWRRECVKGRRWRGPLTNLGAGQTTDVELEIASDVDAQGNLTASLTVVGQPKFRVEFAGVLRLETDVLANGYALDLIKKTAGAASKSPILGNVSTGRHTFFRLGPDGTELIGYAHQGVNEVGPEVLELKRVP